MYDLFLIRGRGIETMLGISSFEIEEFQTFAHPTEKITKKNKKSPIPPFPSEEVKVVTDTPPAAPANKLIYFELTTALVALSFVAFDLICFLLVILLVD